MPQPLSVLGMLRALGQCFEEDRPAGEMLEHCSIPKGQQLCLQHGRLAPWCSVWCRRDHWLCPSGLRVGIASTSRPPRSQNGQGWPNNLGDIKHLAPWAALDFASIRPCMMNRVKLGGDHRCTCVFQAPKEENISVQIASR